MRHNAENAIYELASSYIASVSYSLEVRTLTVQFFDDPTERVVSTELVISDITTFLQDEIEIDDSCLNMLLGLDKYEGNKIGVKTYKYGIVVTTSSEPIVRRINLTALKPTP